MTRPPRPPKKSELLEVRLSHEEKRAFLDACRNAGRTASDVVREALRRFVEDQQAQPEAKPGQRTLIAMIPRNVRKKRYVAVGATLAGVALFAASPSAAVTDLRKVFERFDANGDGVVTAEEFWGAEVSDDVIALARDALRQDAGAIAPAFSRDSFAVLSPPSKHKTGRFAVDGEWGLSITITLRSRRNGDDDPRAHEFVGMDTNQDGVVSFEEYRVRVHAMLSRGFDLLDGDGDGYLTEAEFSFTGNGEALMIRAGGGQEPDCPYAECTRDWSIPAEDLAAGFLQLDTDRDGRVSWSEYFAKS